jgi:hypothetical protein
VGPGGPIIADAQRVSVLETHARALKASIRSLNAAEAGAGSGPLPGPDPDTMAGGRSFLTPPAGLTAPKC